MILVKQAVPVIGTRFSDQRNLRARRSALVGVGIGCRHAKLLNRIRGHSQDAGEGIAGGGRTFLDLARTIRAELRSLGIRRVQDTGLCTMCEEKRFFSYRREKNVQGKVGRLMSVIGRADGVIGE